MDSQKYLDFYLLVHGHWHSKVTLRKITCAALQTAAISHMNIWDQEYHHFMVIIFLSFCVHTKTTKFPDLGISLVLCCG